MSESRARRLAAICLLIIFAPLAAVTWEYLDTRREVLARYQVVTEAMIELVEVEPEVTEPEIREEIYVPPAPIRFPIY